MNTVFAVRTLPVRDAHGAILGWVRADMLADGTRPTDMVVLRDGSALGQAEAAERIALDLGLLYPTREEAVRDGLARLRAHDADSGDQSGSTSPQ
jgi:hypothetical protein